MRLRRAFVLRVRELFAGARSSARLRFKTSIKSITSARRVATSPLFGVALDHVAFVPLFFADQPQKLFRTFVAQLVEFELRVFGAIEQLREGLYGVALRFCLLR